MTSVKDKIAYSLMTEEFNTELLMSLKAQQELLLDVMEEIHETGYEAHMEADDEEDENFSDKCYFLVELLETLRDTKEEKQERATRKVMNNLS